MRGRLLAVAGFIAASVLIGPRLVDAQDAPAAPTPVKPSPPPSTFRSSVDVVSVSAVVRDRKGRFVSNLDRDDFIVAEAGAARPILDFRAQADGPVKVAVLFDISGSMRGPKADKAREAARHIFRTLRPLDEAAVFAFDTRLDRVTEFTSDVAALEAALDRVEPPFGQTSMYDAIADTARVVAEAGSGGGRFPQRSAVIVLTDGIDTRSRLSSQQVSSIASGIDVPVYIVTIISPIDDTRDDGGPVPNGALSNLARWTGGEVFPVSAPAHARVAARQIVDELRHQYVLAFEASLAPGWRPLEVRARDSDLVVRARAGYTAGGTLGPSEQPLLQSRSGHSH